MDLSDSPIELLLKSLINFSLSTNNLISNTPWLEIIEERRREKILTIEERKKTMQIYALHAEITVDKQPNVKDSLVKDYGTFEFFANNIGKVLISIDNKRLFGKYL